MITSTIYRRLRKRDSCKKSLRRKDTERYESHQIVDPSFELFNHCQQFHDEYHQDQPNPECALCNGELGLNTKLFFYYGISFPSKSQSMYERSQSPSISSECSTQGVSPTSQDGTFSQQQSILPTFPFEEEPTDDLLLRQEPASNEDTAQSMTTCHLNQSVTTQEVVESPQELESPPSYDIALATSPRLTRLELFPERPQMVPRLDSPFSEFDPFESLPELSGDSVGYTALQSPLSNTSVSPMTPSYNNVDHSQYPPRTNGSLPSIPERDSDRDEGQGYRDDLIKRGLLI